MNGEPTYFQGTESVSGSWCLLNK